jgi:hypothetical protein
MNLKLIKDNKQSIFLAVVFIIFLYIAIAAPFNNQLVHNQPTGYMASDALIHYIWAEALNDQGGWMTYPAYFAYDYNDTIAYNPPLLYQVSVIFSQVSNIPLYDAIYFLVLFSSLVAVLATFLLIKRHFSENVAYLSIPLTAFLFLGPHYTLFTWGTWIYAVASLFLIALFYLIDEPFYVILLLMAMIITHTSEFIFAVGFIGVYILFKKFTNIKQQIFNVSAAVILSSYYLYIFYNTWMQVTPYQFSIDFASDYTGMIVMTFGDFGWIAGAMIVAGMLLALFTKKFNTATLAGFVMLGIGYTSLIGFGLRAFQTRFFWPLYFAAFVGYFLYMIISNFKKLEDYIPIISIALLIILLFTNVRPSYSQSLLAEDRYAELQWTKNISINDTHLYFYSDDIQQAAMLWLSKRTPNYIGAEDLSYWLNNNLTRYTPIRKLADSKSHYAYWDGINVKHHWDEMNYSDTHITDICSFDYYHFSALNNDPSLTELHNQLINIMLNHGNQLVYNEGSVAVVRNLNKGEDCFDR